MSRLPVTASCQLHARAPSESYLRHSCGPGHEYPKIPLARPPTTPRPLEAVLMSLLRVFALLAFALQAALGPAHLTLEVCHGEVQLPANDGSPCCSAEHCNQEENESEPGRPSVLNAECPDCFDIELVGSDGPADVPNSVELPSPPTSAVAAVVELPRARAPRFQQALLVTRGPPGSLTPTGLLPGVFPLRI